MSWDGGSDECILCGRVLKRAPRFMVHLLTTGGYTDQADHPDSQGLFPIGNECRKKVEERFLFPTEREVER